MMERATSVITISTLFKRLRSGSFSFFKVHPYVKIVIQQPHLNPGACAYLTEKQKVIK